MIAQISTIIVDDEASYIRSLCNDLAAYPQIQVIETATTIERAKKIILQQQPSLLFLGIDMPKMNGIELLNEIKSSIHPNICVVFYSAFDKYLLDALRASAFDYLKKPHCPEDLKLIIDRIIKKKKSENVTFEQSIRRLFADERKFALYTVSCLFLLKRSEILCFQYFKQFRYWQMTLTDMSTHKLRLSTTAKEILNMSNIFIQISQDCIINIDYLAAIENKSLRCRLYPPFDTLDIYISRRNFFKIKERLEII